MTVNRLFPAVQSIDSAVYKGGGSIHLVIQMKRDGNSLESPSSKIHDCSILPNSTVLLCCTFRTVTS